MMDSMEHLNIEIYVKAIIILIELYSISIQLNTLIQSISIQLANFNCFAFKNYHSFFIFFILEYFIESIPKIIIGSE